METTENKAINDGFGPEEISEAIENFTEAEAAPVPAPVVPAPVVLPTEEEIREARERGRKIQRETVCLDLEFTRNSFVKRIDAETCIDTDVPADSVSVDVDVKRFAVNKRIIDKTWLKRINAVRSALISDTIKPNFVESRMLRGGMYLIPLKLVSKVEARLKLAKKDFEIAVEDFLSEYENAKDEARADLTERYYNEADYPSVESLRADFTMKWTWKVFNVSEALKQVSAELFEEELKKAEVEWASAAEDIKAGLRASLSELVNAAYEKLTPDADGKKKVLHESVVNKIKDFLETFEARNLAGDTELGDLAEKARRMLDGVTGKDVRKSEALRETMRANMEALKTEMDGLVLKRGRKIELED